MRWIRGGGAFGRKFCFWRHVSICCDLEFEGVHERSVV